MKIFNLLLILIFSTNVFAQTFSAEFESEVFYGDSDGKFSANVKLLSGILKTGDEAVAYAETGRKFNVKILKMSVEAVNETSGTKDLKPVTQAKAPQRVWVEFFTKDNSGGGSDYLTKGFKVFPKGFNYTPKNNQTNTNPKQTAVFAATIDGKPFKAALAYKGALLYRKGVTNFQEKPFLQLSFTSIDAVDNRILLFWILNPKESVSAYTEKDLEVNFSGAVDGKRDNTTIYGFKNGKADTKFTVEISQWKNVSPGKAIISGKIYGELREVKLIGRAVKVNRFAGGVFENVEIEIFQ